MESLTKAELLEELKTTGVIENAQDYDGLKNETIASLTTVIKDLVEKSQSATTQLAEANSLAEKSAKEAKALLEEKEQDLAECKRKYDKKNEDLQRAYEEIAALSQPTSESDKEEDPNSHVVRRRRAEQETAALKNKISNISSQLAALAK